MHRMIRIKVWWDTRFFLHRLSLVYGTALLAFLIAGFFLFLRSG